MSTLTLSKRKISLKTLTLTIGFAALTAMLGSPAYAADPEKKLDEQASQAEQTVDEMQQMEVPPPAETPPAEDEAETPQGDEETPSDEGETLPAGTESETITAPTDAANAENCFTQADGSIECICVTAESCEELMASDTCEAETTWQKDDSYGGCTQKQPE